MKGEETEIKEKAGNYFFFQIKTEQTTNIRKWLLFYIMWIKFVISIVKGFFNALCRLLGFLTKPLATIEGGFKSNPGK